MKTSFCLLAAVLLLSGATASAQAYFTAPDELALTGAGTPTATASVHTQLLPGGGSITYFEAASSPDGQQAQFAQLRQTFEAVMPTTVLYEGVDCGVGATEAATIAHMGPAGYVRFLAQQYDVPAKSLDSGSDAYEYLRPKTDPEQLKLYYLLQAVQRFQTRPDASKKLTTKAMLQLLANSYAFVPGTELTIRNLTELKAAYRKHCPSGGKWWKTPAAYFEEGASLASSPYPCFRTITNARAEFGRQYRANQLAAHAQAGQRVLVVVAPGSLPVQGLPGGQASGN
jgi:hypothetical protein